MTESWVDRWLDDLEQRVTAEALLERDQEVDLLVEDTYRSVGWADRLRGAQGGPVALEVAGYGHASGSLERVGSDWCLLRSQGVHLVVMLTAVNTLRAPTTTVVTADAEPVLAGLGVGAVMRRAVSEGRPLRLFLVDGSVEQGVPVRSGRDFVEVAGVDGGPSVVVPWGRLAAFAVR